jgi:hypothetical protein
MATARYHKVKIGEHELNAETLMLGYGYDRVSRSPPPDGPRHQEPLVSRKASFRMLTLYDMDRMTETHAGAFLNRLEEAFLRF